MKEAKAEFEKEEEKVEELAGHIDYIFSVHRLEDLRQQLSSLFALVNDGSFSAAKIKKKEIKSLCKILHALLDGCYETYRASEKDGFKITECKRKLVKGPFTERELTSAHLFEQKMRIHDGKIIFLDFVESLDIYVFFEDFFSHDSVVKWKERIDVWKRHALRRDHLHDTMEDVNLFTSYVQLSKLFEAAYLLREWGLRSLPNSPVGSFFHIDDQPSYIAVEAMFNPFEYLNSLFRNENASSLKKKLRIWLDAARTGKKVWNYGEPTELIRFHDYFQAIMETGFIIKHCDFIFENWMNKEVWYSKFEPKREGEGYMLEDHHLTNEEVNNPYLAIDEIFWGHLSIEQYTLKEWLEAALSEEEVIEDKYDHHLKFMRVIEALYLINVQIYFGSESLKLNTCQGN